MPETPVSPFAAPADADLDPRLREQLTLYWDSLGVGLPLDAVFTFRWCWVRLCGMVSLEVFGHLHFALDDASPLFELTLAELAQMLGLAYRPASPSPSGGEGNAQPGGAGVEAAALPSRGRAPGAARNAPRGA